MSTTAKFLSSALTGNVFEASASFAGQTRNLTIPVWGSPGGIDTTAPVLSAPTAVAAGATGGVGGVTTDEGNGTLCWAVTTSATAPSASDLKTGTGAVAHGLQTVFSTGAKTTSPTATGLAPSTTYYFHFIHTDLAGNESNIVSSGAFTTDALGTGTGTITIAVENRMGLQVAPEPIAFRAGVSGASVSEPATRNDYDPTAHDLIYVWDFGDPMGAQSDKVVNLPAAWNNMNQGEGKYPIHVYPNPGTYTVTCTVYERDGTLVGADTFVITIPDPDTVFSGNRTIAVAANGNFSGAPTGAAQETSIANAIANMNSQGMPCRILLKRGESYAVGGGIGLFGSSPNFYLDAWGSGNRPIVQGDNSTTPAFFLTFSSFRGRSLVSKGIKFQGTWDSTTETGNKNPSAIATNGVHVLATDCVMDGVNFGLSVGGSVGDNVMAVLHNSEVTNFVNFGMGGTNPGNYNGCIGNAIYHSLQANEGLSGSSAGPGNRHGPIRLPSGPVQYISGNDLFSRSGWAGTHQPCIRPISTVRSEEVTYCHIARNAMEGGDILIQGTHNSGSNASVGKLNLVIENNLGVGTFLTRGFISTQFPSMTLRNNLFIIPNTPRNHGGNIFFVDDWGSLTIQHPNDPVRIHNNTMIVQVDENNRAGKTFQFLSTDASPAGGRWNNFDQRNDVLQAPNAPSQQGENALLSLNSLATVGGTWATRMLGRKYGVAAINQNPSIQLTMDPSRATPTFGVMFDYAPGPGSPLIDDADTALTSVFDGFGDQVSSASLRDRGWRERIT